jgi:ADP-ribose pyrophosphatase YjhB (NUDIX family)
VSGKNIEFSQPTTVISASYVEKDSETIPRVLLDNKEYGLLLQRCVPLCADLVIFDQKDRLIYLTRRISIPWPELWWIGGLVDADADPITAAVGNMKRETGIEVDPKRLTLIARNDYRWKDRAQSPPMGCHMEACLFSVELTAAELAAIELDPKEYDLEFGIRPFGLAQLTEAEVHPAILHAYLAIFP